MDATDDLVMARLAPASSDDRMITVSEPYPVLGLNLEGASRVVGVSRSTLRSWRSAGIYRSSFDQGLADEGELGPALFGFRDLLDLRALADLRRDLGLRRDDLARTGRYLGEHRDLPWTNLGFGTLGRKLVLRDPATGQWETDRPVEVSSIDLTGLIESVRLSVDAALQRSPDQIGRIERHRNVMRNKPVIAGTRIPVATIQEYADEGYTTQDILLAHPHLHTEDIEAALAYAASSRVA